MLVINGEIVEHQIPDDATSVKARTRVLNVHVGSEGRTTEQPQQTNVMVIVGATDDRMEALRGGNRPEIVVESETNQSPGVHEQAHTIRN